MTRVLTKEEIKKVIAKYNVGNEVVYLDNNKEKCVGIIKDIEWIIDEPNNKFTPLYLVDGCEFLRTQKDILKLFKKFNPKYKVGDKVYYSDNKGMENVGTIKNVETTYMSDWNDEIRPLYLISGCQYLRSEKDVLYDYIPVEDDEE